MVTLQCWLEDEDLQQPKDYVLHRDDPLDEIDKHFKFRVHHVSNDIAKACGQLQDQIFSRHGLVMLGMIAANPRTRQGEFELPRSELEMIGRTLGWRCTTRADMPVGNSPFASDHTKGRTFTELLKHDPVFKAWQDEADPSEEGIYRYLRYHPPCVALLDYRQSMAALEVVESQLVGTELVEKVVLKRREGYAPTAYNIFNVLKGGFGLTE